MGKQVVAGFKGLQLSWLERTPDKREVGGSSPLKPTVEESTNRTLKTEYRRSKSKRLQTGNGNIFEKQK